MNITKKIIYRLNNFYRRFIVKEQYPMLTHISKMDCNAKGAWGFVFMLHHVMEKNPKGIPSNEDLKVSPAFLEKIIVRYRNKGFDFVSLDELSNIISSDSKPERPFIAITLDDGYLDNYEKAFPIFKKYQIPFCIFLATDFADKKAILWWDCLENLILSHNEVTTRDGVCYPCRTRKQRQTTFHELKKRILKLDQSKLDEIELNKMFCNYSIDWLAPIKQEGLSWEQVIELSEHPLCTIGGHTVSHLAFDRLSEERIKKEISDGVKNIESVIGKKVHHFSYPYGSARIIGEREYKIIEEFSFKTAFCSYGGCITKSNYKSIIQLPRIGLCE